MSEPNRSVETLIDQLRRRGFLEADGPARALEAVPRADLVPEVCLPLANVDAPAPLADPTLEAAPCPSPRLTVTLLQAMGIEPGHDVLVEGAGVVWLAALAAHVSGDGVVRAVERDPAVRQAVRDRLDDLPVDNLVVGGPGQRGDVAVDRAFVADPREAGEPSAVAERVLEDPGQLLAVQPDPDGGGLELVRVLRHGPAQAEMRLGDVHVADPPSVPDGDVEAGPGAEAGGPVTVRQLLALEALAETAWHPPSTSPDRPEDSRARSVRQAVRETIGQALDERGLTASDPVRARAARGAYHVGYALQSAGEFSTAVDAYGASAEILPTAEAYTFRGWARRFVGDLDQAIEDCKLAIETDPALGNPYNDIGAYLIEQGRPEDAIEWLEDALEAERYDSPQFPHLNLGRAYLAIGERDEAKRELERALEIDPDYAPAEQLLEEIEQDESPSEPSA